MNTNDEAASIVTKASWSDLLKTRKGVMYVALAIGAILVIYTTCHYADRELRQYRFQKEMAKLESDSSIPPDQKRILKYFYLAKNFYFQLLCQLHPELDLAKKSEGGYIRRVEYKRAADSPQTWNPLAIDIDKEEFTDLKLDQRLVITYEYEGGNNRYYDFELRFFGEKDLIVEKFIQTIALLPSQGFIFAHRRNYNGYLSLIVGYEGVYLEGSIYQEGDDLVGFWDISPSDDGPEPDFNAENIFHDIDHMRTWLMKDGITQLKASNHGLVVLEYYWPGYTYPLYD